MTADSTVITAIVKVVLLRCECAEHLKSEEKSLSQMKMYSHLETMSSIIVNAPASSLINLSEINIQIHKEKKELNQQI